MRTSYPEIPLALVGLFCVLTFTIWLELGVRIEALGAVRFEFMLAALAAGIALSRWFSSAHRNHPNADIAAWAFTFLFVQLVSLPLAIDIGVAWAAYVDHMLKFAIIGALVPMYLVTPFALRAYMLTTLLAFLKVGQEAFLGKVTGSMVWENQGVQRLNGTPGTMFSHPNSLSGKTVSVMPFAFYFYPILKQKWAKILIFVFLLFAANIIVFTGSRTGYLTAIVAVILLVLMAHGSKFKLALLAACLAMAAVIFVPTQYKERFVSAFTHVEKEGRSADTRKALLVDSWNTFLEHPLGIGAKCFAISQRQAGRNPQPTHNLYTELLAETGIQGMICFAGLLIVMLRKAFLTRRRLTVLIRRLKAFGSATQSDLKQESEIEISTARLFLATTNGVIVFLLVRLALGLFGNDLFEIYWWLAAGLIMALYNFLLIAERRYAELTGERLCTDPQARRTVRRRPA